MPGRTIRLRVRVARDGWAVTVFPETTPDSEVTAHALQPGAHHAWEFHRVDRLERPVLSHVRPGSSEEERSVHSRRLPSESHDGGLPGHGDDPGPVRPRGRCHEHGEGHREGEAGAPMSVRTGSIAVVNLAWLAREVWASHPGMHRSRGRSRIPDGASISPGPEQAMSSRRHLALTGPRT